MRSAKQLSKKQWKKWRNRFEAQERRGKGKQRQLTLH